MWREVSFIRCSFLLSCCAKRLARGRPRPDGAVVGPPGQTQGVGPAADAREEMALRKPCDIRRRHVEDRPFVYLAIGD